MNQDGAGNDWANGMAIAAAALATATAGLAVIGLTAAMSIINNDGWAAFRIGLTIVFAVAPGIAAVLAIIAAVAGRHRILCIIVVIASAFTIASYWYVCTNLDVIGTNIREQVTEQVKTEVGNEVGRAIGETKQKAKDSIDGVLDQLGLGGLVDGTTGN